MKMTPSSDRLAFPTEKPVFDRSGVIERSDQPGASRCMQPRDFILNLLKCQIEIPPSRHLVSTLAAIAWPRFDHPRFPKRDVEQPSRSQPVLAAPHSPDLAGIVA